MRIAFDGTALRPGRTGVGYYSEHLLHHLARAASDDELIVVSNRAIDTTSPLPARVRVATARGHVPRLVWMQTLAATRSEEHTSELQSLRHLVCRLLLEKKKKNRKKHNHIHTPETTQVLGI